MTYFNLITRHMLHKHLRTFSDLGGDKFRLFISKIYLKIRKEATELINIWIPL